MQRIPPSRRRGTATLRFVALKQRIADDTQPSTLEPADSKKESVGFAALAAEPSRPWGGGPPDSFRLTTLNVLRGSTM